MSNLDNLKGKTIVITGVTSGFGRGSAIRLAELGANIVGAARRSNILEELGDEIKHTGGKIYTVPCDVSKVEDIEKLEEAAIETFGKIDIWINNVGVGALGFFWDIPLSDHSRLIDVNLKGLIYGSHVAIRHFIKNKQGILINLGSVDSEVPIAMQNTYAATKAGVLSLGHSLNEELKLSDQEDIKVATIMPYAVDTPWWIHAANYTGHKPRMAAMDDPEKVVEKIVEACVNPKEEMTVGAKATASDIFHQIFPGLTEHLSGKTFKKESEKADPAAHTSGSLYEPMEAGTTVEGNIRERMKKEDNS
jgi:short-subunit dehydrogenase